MTISVTAFQFLIVSVIGQFLFAVVYAREALTTPLGDYCRIKCTLATVVFLLVGVMLTWLVFASSVDRCPG